MRGDRIGIIGPNGCGKSTLIKLFLNQLTPQSGRVTSGTNLLTLYFDQQREQLDPDKTVIENLNLSSDSVTLNGKQRHVISYLQDFLFAPQRAQSPVRALSGGEQNRLLLARLFTRPANLMILDEPTNDLDVESLEVLEELISNFEGTVIMVSHDRAFLDNLVSSVWVFEGEGRIEEYVGGYSDWQRQRRATINTPTVSPKPVSDASGMAKSAGTTKLSYREKRELEELPQHIERLEAEQQQLEQRMAQPEFYQQAQQDIKVQLQRISEIRDDLASAYRRWELLDQRT
jgi:ATP-binding cassette subfamily F protein uup